MKDYIKCDDLFRDTPEEKVMLYSFWFAILPRKITRDSGNKLIRLIGLFFTSLWSPTIGLLAVPTMIISSLISIIRGS